MFALETEEQKHARNQKAFAKNVNDELADKKMSKFAYKNDLNYKDAWWMHYSGCSPTSQLLPSDIGHKIYDSIEQFFLLHLCVLRSLIFPVKAHEPARRITKGYYANKRALVNHFCTLIRTRNPMFLLHWAMMGTLAMYCRGLSMKSYRNPVLKAFSADVRTTFLHLDAIYAKTAETRMALIEIQKVKNHGSDNYQEYHRLVVP